MQDNKLIYTFSFIWSCLAWNLHDTISMSKLHTNNTKTHFLCSQIIHVFHFASGSKLYEKIFISNSCTENTKLHLHDA